MSAHFDAVIVGAGQAGPSLAGRLTAAGQRVAIVERKLIGGTCGAASGFSQRSRTNLTVAKLV